MNYSLDPLTAITARPHFYQHTGNFSMERKKVYKKIFSNKLIEKEFHVSGTIIRRAKLELFGECRKMNEQEYQKLRQYIIDRKNNPRKKNPFTIIALAEKHGINRNTAISHSINLLGKRCNYTTDEFDMLNNYFANVIIRRPMKRVKK